jgi:hypothetical protein
MMISRGFVALSDGFVAVDSRGLVYPGLRWIQLWPDDLKALQLLPESVRSVRPNSDKKYLVIEPNSGTRPKVPSTVFFLRQQNIDHNYPISREIRGIQKIALLQAANFSWDASIKMQREESHSYQLWDFFGEIKMFEIIRPIARPTRRDVAEVVGKALHTSQSY